MIRHLVWDWNGTLFDDQEVVTQATNASLLAVGVTRRITALEYQRDYRRPIDLFYQDLVGRPVTPDEWPLLDAAFQAHYREFMHTCGLNREALSAMDGWLPRTQSLLSMFGHDELLTITEAFGLQARFGRIDGRPPQTDFGSKDRHLVRHLGELRRVDPSLAAEEVALIGDSLDDAHAAAHVGAVAVLYTGGSSSRAVLETAGVPVVDSLSEAVSLLADR